MTPSLPARRLRWRFVRYLIPCLLLGGACVGCGGASYSPELLYPARLDPIFRAVPITELTTPDAPGQFPVLSFATLSQPDNPLHPFLVAQQERERKARDAQTKLGADSYQILDPLVVSADRRAELDAALEKMFGTPQQPRVGLAGFLIPPREDDDEAETAAANVKAVKDVADVVAQLRLDPGMLAKGSRLYRINCLHCHGLAGDGRGPTAPWVNPHPRDFRAGLFKFITTADTSNSQRPRRDDILRTLKVGLDGSLMPAFNVLPDDELEAIASYVIHLAMRGEVEQSTLIELFKWEIERPAKEPTGGLTGKLADSLWQSVRDWLRSQPELAPAPYSPPSDDAAMTAAVQRGQQFFLKNGCAVCHADYGRKSTFRFDKWGTLARPADLTAGIYRGGRRPLDLYCRAKLGIGSCNMPGLGNDLTPGLWDLVQFLQILPYRPMREKYGVQID